MIRSSFLPPLITTVLFAAATIVVGEDFDRISKPGFGCVDSQSMDFEFGDREDPLLELQPRSRREIPKELPSPIFTARFDRPSSIRAVDVHVWMPPQGVRERPRVFARTSARTNDRGGRNGTWWEVTPRKGKRLSQIGFLRPYSSSHFRATWAVDKRTPLLRATRLTPLPAMNSLEKYEDHLLLDFRGPIPAVRAALRCTSSEGGSYCGASDRSWGPKNTVQCAWSSERSDFVCDVASALPYPWVERHFRARFLLFSGRDVPAETERRVPRGLREFAEALEESRGGPEWVTGIPGGTFQHVARIPPDPARQRVLHVFASPRDTEAFDQRFFLVTLRGASTEVRQIPTSQKFSGASNATAEPEEEADDSNWQELEPKRTYETRTILDRRPELLLLQVVVSEGSGRGVFWIGFEEKESGPVVDVLRVATDAAEYVQCNSFRHAASSVDVPSPVVLPVTLRVQPEWSDGNAHPFRSDTPTSPAALCLEPWRVAWTNGQGFSLERKASDCATLRRPLHIRIGEKGDVRLVEADYRHDRPTE